MKKVLRSTLLCCAGSFLMFSLAACGKDAIKEKTAPLVKNGVARKLPKLLDLGAHKCIPCKKMAPVLDELAREYQGVFDVEFIDVWQPENKETATAHKIQAIPTQIFFDASGKELWRHVGFISKDDILKKWQELGYIFRAVPQEKSSAEAAVSEKK